MSDIKSPVEQVKALETKRGNLPLEIEELKKMAYAKANSLESEINMLREEEKKLRVLLSGDGYADSDWKKRN